jgi:phytoene dehydrogenase-like protein
MPDTATAIPALDMDLTVEVADTVTVFASSEWDALLVPTDYFRHGYLSALEASGLDCQFHYAVLRAGRAIIGLGFGYLVRFDLGRWRPKVWLAGSPVNLGYPFAFAAGFDTPEVQYRLQAALFERARLVGALYFLLRDLPASDPGKPSAVAAPLRLLSIPLHCTAILPLPVSNFEAYLAGLKGSRRKSVRRDIRAVEEAGLHLSIERPSQGLVLRLLELWLPLYRKYHDPDQIRLTEGYFHAMTMRPEAVFLLLWQGETLVAFDLCLWLGSRLSSIFSGIDSARTGDLPVHRYMGYAIVRHAIATGCTAVDFGISNEEEKARMGCRLEMLYGYGRPVSAVLHGLGIGRLARALFAAEPSRFESSTPILDDTRSQMPLAAPAISQGRQRAIVIGAGLSGLAAAAKLAADPRVEVIVLERETEIGGLCRTVTLDDGRKGFVGGCNLFSPRFFSLLNRACSIKLPTRRARILTYYDGMPLDTLMLAGRLATPTSVAVLGSLVGAGLCGSRRSMADVAARAGGRESLVADLALLPFLLQGQDPQRWLVGAGLAKLLRVDAYLYPVPGLASVPQSLRRFIERHPAARIELKTVALAIAAREGKVVGVHTQRGELPAEIVISSLPPETTRLLFASGNSDVAQRPEGLLAMAVFLLLDATFHLPPGYYSFTFIAPDVHGQLRDLFAGRMPEQLSFDLVCPDLAEGRPSAEGWRVTIFATCPAGKGNAAVAQIFWQHMCERLERIFPGFTAAIRWCKVVPPDDYLCVAGCVSRLSPYADAPPQMEEPSWAMEGLHLTHGPAGLQAGDTLAALQSGLICASRVLERSGHASGGRVVHA